MSRPILLLLAAAALATSGCTTTYQRGPEIDTSAPLRVAVLPFVDASSGDLITSRPFTAALDRLPVLGSEYLETPATALRNRVIANLKRSSFDLINPSIVDQKLQANELYEVGRLQAMRARPGELGRLLKADLVVFGRLLKWDRQYYAVETVVRVAARLTIVDVESEREVYASQQVESSNRGVSGGPTGISDIVSQPIFGLSNSAFRRLNSDLARKLTEPLIAGGEVGQVPPFIAAAVRSEGADGALEVLMVGSPGGRAHMQVGVGGPMVPLVEVGEGRYRGSYLPAEGESVDAPSIGLSLERKGRKTTTRLGAS